MWLHFWSRQNPVLVTAECVKVAQTTAVDVYQWFREVRSTRLINDGPIVLGGPGIVVQIDESVFKHKPKVHTTETHTHTHTSTHSTLSHQCVQIYFYSVSQRKTRWLQTMGLWDGGHLKNTISRLHADGGHTWCCHATTYYLSPYSTRNYHPLRWVGGLCTHCKGYPSPSAWDSEP